MNAVPVQLYNLSWVPLGNGLLYRSSRPQEEADVQLRSAVRGRFLKHHARYKYTVFYKLRTEEDHMSLYIKSEFAEDGAKIPSIVSPVEILDAVDEEEKEAQKANFLESHSENSLDKGETLVYLRILE